MARLANGKHQRPIKCKVCGKKESATVTISRRGNCLKCGIAAATDAIRQQHAKTGPVVDKAARGAIAYYERVLSER